MTNLKTVYSGIDKSSINRKSNDFYPTPHLATYILHKYSNIPQNIVEPCAGTGFISKELERNGYNVKSYDLYEYDNCVTNVDFGHDVLKLEKQNGFDALITNPPYRSGMPLKILKKAVKEYSYVALLIRLTFLESISRYHFFNETKPSQFIFFSDRINFSNDRYSIDKKDQIGGMIAYMWIIFDKNTNEENTKCDWVLMNKEYDEWIKDYENSI